VVIIPAIAGWNGSANIDTMRRRHNILKRLERMEGSGWV
jgi:hypothetical protein